MSTQSSGNQATIGGGLGGALGVIAVIMAPKTFEGFTWTPEEASMMTAALGIAFGWAVRFLPKPKS